MLPNEIIEKRILISVLNWGMGHVSRSIGLINQLLEQKNVVVIACSIEQEEIFKQYFDTVEFIRHDGYPFTFGGKGNFAWDLFKGLIKLKKRMKREQKEVEAMIAKYSIDLVLSDHRYGFYSPIVPSYFITHQFNLPVPWYQRNADRLHKKLMSKFDLVWIMDYPDSRLAGKLSQTKNSGRLKYIGPYSRFSLYPKNQFSEKDKTVLIASGPKVYAQELIETYFTEHKSKSIVVICSEDITVPIDTEKISGNWKIQDEYILSAKKIISRSGYSTIMDLEVLNCDAQLIPTPGQVEQVYLKYYRINKR